MPPFSDIEPRKNWALGADAYQASTQSTQMGAEKAVDGNADPVVSHGSCAVTRRTRRVMWSVQTDDVIDIDEIVIVTSTDCCGKLS